MNSVNDVDSSYIRPDGETALNVHLSNEKERIIREATRLNRGERLSANAINNAIGSLKVRDRMLPSLGHARFRLIPILFTLLALSSSLSVLVLIIIFTQDWNLDAELPPIWNGISLGIAVMCAALGVVAVVGALRARRSEMALRYDILTAANKSDLIANQPKRHSNSDFLDFMRYWISIERTIRHLGFTKLSIPTKDAERYPIGELLGLLTKENILSHEAYEKTRNIMRLRNLIVHGGIEEIDQESLFSAKELSQYFNEII